MFTDDVCYQSSYQFYYDFGISYQVRYDAADEFNLEFATFLEVSMNLILKALKPTHISSIVYDFTTMRFFSTIYVRCWGVYDDWKRQSLIRADHEHKPVLGKKSERSYGIQKNPFQIKLVRTNRWVS